MVQSAQEAFLSNVIGTIACGASVQLIGFDASAAGSRTARAGRDPWTDKKIKIAAARAVKLSAGKAFKDAVNNK